MTKYICEISVYSWFYYKETSFFLISGFHRAFFKVSHFYWPTNALNCIKLKD